METRKYIGHIGLTSRIGRIGRIGLIRPIRPISPISPIRPISLIIGAAALAPIETHIRLIRPIRPIRHIIFVLLLVGFAAALAAPAMAQASVLQKIPNNLGLVGYWPMNEGTSTIAGDFSGNGNNGTLTNDPAWVDGKRGKALNFDGVNDYVGGTNVVNIAKTTMSAWIKIPVTPAVNGQVVGFENGINSGTYDKDLYIGTDRKLYFYVYAGGSKTTSAPANPVNLNEWTHIVGVADGANAITYVNGVQVGSIAAGDTYTAYTVPNIFISGSGSTNPVLSGTYLNGLIDEVRVYNRALGASEITALYNSGAAKLKAPNNLGLVGYWPMNEGTSTIAGDFSGNGNSATAVGGPGAWATGKLGKAYDLQQVNNGHFNAGSAASLDNIEKITIVAWTAPDNAGETSSGACSGGNLIQKAEWCFGFAGTSNKWKLQYRWSFGGTNWITSSAPFTPNGTYHHVALTYDGSSTSNDPVIYVDGIPQTLDDASPGGTRNDDSGGDLIIGMGVADINEYDGRIDEIRVYNRVLSAAEITSLYNSGLAKINSSQNSRLTDGLVGMWSFNGADLTTTTAFDRSGNGNNGTLTNGPITAIGKVGQALNFDGVDDYVSVNDHATLNLPNSFSVSFWMKHNAATWPASWQGIVTKRIVGSANYGFDVNLGNSVNENDCIDDTNGFQWFYKNSANTDWRVIDIDTNRVPTNTWVHVVGTAEASGSNRIMTLYIDNIVQSTATCADAPITNAAPVRFGNYDSTEYFNGLIDEVRVYNRALSAAEVLQLYNMGK